MVESGRKQGVGSLLMETALAFAIEAGYDALYLYVFRALTQAIRLYLHHGFFIAAQCVCIPNVGMCLQRAADLANETDCIGTMHRVTGTRIMLWSKS